MLDDIHCGEATANSGGDLLGQWQGRFPAVCSWLRWVRLVYFLDALAAVLYCAGILHWIRFFSGADLRVLDWRLSVDYQSVLRDALARGTIPYLTTLNYHYTDRFLGTPETPLSPQYLLLPFWSALPFNIVNVCFLFTIGYVGLLAIRREYNLSWLPFTFLYLLFNFNGYLIAHVAAGHTMWYGYFFLPFFHLLLLRLIDGRRDTQKSVVLLVLTLFLIELQGSFHLYIWCLMFLLLVAVFNPRVLRPAVTVAVWSFLLCLFRFLPAAVTLQGKELEFCTGFPSLGILVDAFTVINDCRQAGKLGWWEFDCFIGMTGFFVLLYFGIFLRIRNGSTSRYCFRELDVPSLCMVLLSLGSVYGLLLEFRIPLLDSQRVASRFIVIPLTLFMILAALQLQEFLRTKDVRRTKVVSLTFLMIFLAWELHLHSSVWRISALEVYYWKDYVKGVAHACVKTMPIGDADIDRYVRVVHVSAIVSGLLLIHFAGRLFRLWRRRKTETE